jgi:hypothetical protein
MPRKSPNPISAKVKIPGGWFEPTGHVYRDEEGNRVLSVTQVFQILGLTDYGDVNPATLKHKSEIGIAVHKALELLLQNNLDWDTVDEIAMNYVIGAELWFRNMKFQLGACEQQGIFEIYGMKIGYQYDQRGSIEYQGQRHHVIVDLKTALKESPAWPLQTAAYVLAAPPLDPSEQYLRVVLHLQKDGRVKPIYYKDPQDQQTFLYMAYTAVWKMNHGYQLPLAA